MTSSSTVCFPRVVFFYDTNISTLLNFILRQTTSENTTVCRDIQQKRGITPLRIMIKCRYYIPRVLFKIALRRN